MIFSSISKSVAFRVKFTWYIETIQKTLKNIIKNWLFNVYIVLLIIISFNATYTKKRGVNDDKVLC